tara:strand:+ start:1057 stop:1218 length:162 start_codon:yes stop_codon:yes gene_type:complete
MGNHFSIFIDKWEQNFFGKINKKKHTNVYKNTLYTDFPPFILEPLIDISVNIL